MDATESCQHTFASYRDQLVNQGKHDNGSFNEHGEPKYRNSRCKDFPIAYNRSLDKFPSNNILRAFFGDMDGSTADDQGLFVAINIDVAQLTGSNVKQSVSRLII